MSTGTLDLTRVEEERRRREETEPAAIAHRIVEEVLAADAALDTAEREDEQAQEPTDESSPHDRVRRDLVLLGTDPALVLLPGPLYEPGPGAWRPQRDPLRPLVDGAVASLTSAPRTVGEALRGAADSPAMPTTRWLLLGLLWMAAFAGLVPFAFATIGNALEMEVDIGDEPVAEQPAIEQQPDDASTDNPSVEGDAGG